MGDQKKMRVPSISSDNEPKKQWGISVEPLGILHLSCENVFLSSGLLASVMRGDVSYCKL